MMSIIEHLTSISSYLLAFIWGFFILVSLIGWGQIINLLLFSKHRVGWGQKAAWGMAFSICIGGLLNLTSLISQTTILIYLISGFLSWLIDFFYDRKFSLTLFKKFFNDCRKDRVFLLGCLIVSGLILIQYSGWVYSHKFHIGDDLGSYFVFPNQMLQTGSLSPDPFNARRIVTSLGGQAFLQTFILSVFDEANLNLIDPGIALIVTILLILEYCNKKNISQRQAVFLLFLFLLIPYPRTNTTSSLTATALFLSFFMILEWEGLKFSNFKVNACLIALITAAICSLKNSFIPACGILFILSYLFYILEAQNNNRRSAIYEFILASILTLLFILPWMISLYQSSGTLLYPVLGKGYHGSVYTGINYSYEKLTLALAIQIIIEKMKSIDFIALVILGLIGIRSRMRNVASREALLSFFLSAVLGTLIIIIVNGGFDTTRYPFPFVFPALIVLTINACTKLNHRDNQKFLSFNALPIAMVLMGMMIGGNTVRSFYKQNNIDKIRVGLGNLPLVSARESGQYLKMQQAVPAGEVFLARVEKPFLLDFKQNRILVADVPGEASPPPGVPLYKGSEALADYLVSQSIRYVAYAYKSELGMTREVVEYRLKNWNFSRWVTIESKQTLDFQENLKELGQTRKRIYDDGEFFVLDLLNRTNIR